MQRKRIIVSTIIKNEINDAAKDGIRYFILKEIIIILEMYLTFSGTESDYLRDFTRYYEEA